MPGDRAATGPHVLRQINVAGVLQALRASADLTARVSDLVAATGLSRPAVTRALNSLEAARIIESAGAEVHQLGRPAVRVRFRAELGHVAGIDIGPHSMALLIADLAGATRASRRIALPPNPTGPDLVELAGTELTDLARQAGIQATQLWAVAVGTPGIVDHDRGEVVLAPSIPGWTGLPMLTGLRERLECPVLLDNDVNLSVLAEQWRGETSSTLLYVHWGERIGSGLVIDGKPWRGAGSAAGELGFLDLVTPIDATPPPISDDLGPFERLAGAEAIRRLALQTCGSTVAAALTTSHDLAPLFRAAEDGDPPALSVIDTIAARFARGLAAHLLLIDPGRVVVGGGLARAGGILLNAVRRHLELLVLAPFDLRASSLRENAVVTGAIRMALDTAEQRLATML